MHVVLIGGSGFGRYHLQIWRKHPRVSALTVVGRNPDSLAATAAEFDVAVSTDLAAALDQADLVDVVTPTDTHAALARQALDHGRPTLVEKPPCRTADEAVALAEHAARAGQVPLACVMNQRFSPLWRRVRELVADGAVGTPRLSLWPVLTDQRALMTGDDFRADAAHGGGALLDGAFHLAYLIPWVLAAPVRAMTAWAGQLAAQPPAGEDTGLLALEVGQGVAQVTYSWAVANPPRTPAATIIGDAATLIVPRSARQPLLRLHDRQEAEVDLGAYRTMPRNDLANCLHHHGDAILSRHAPESSWVEAVTAQRVIEAAERSAAEGRRVNLT